RNLVEHAFDVFRKDVQAFRRDDHFLLPAADEEFPAGPDLADVAGVKPAALERLRRLLGRVEVALRHVLAAHEDLAVRRDLHLDAGHGLADRALLRPEGVIEAHDRRGFREAVTLDDHESQLAPERLERRVERSRADDERPELQAEQSMNFPEMPPAPHPMALRTWRRGLRRDAQDVLAQHV